MNAAPDTTPRLADYLDLATLQHLQDAFASLFGVVVLMTDAQGESITEPTRPTAYSRLTYESPAGRAEYLAAAKAVALKTLSAGDTLYVPTSGPIRYAAAIVVGDQRVACILMGDRPSDPGDPKEIAELARRFDLPLADLQQACAQLPDLDPQRMSQALELLRLMAQTLGRLANQEHQLRGRLDELNTIYDISGLLTGQVPIDEALHVVARRVAEVLGVAACSIRLLMPETGEFRLAASHGLNDEHVAATRLQPSPSMIDAEALKGRMVYVQDMQTDPRSRYREVLKASGLHSALTCPIMHHGHALGSMRIFSTQVQVFTGFDAALLRAIASQIGSAVAYYRLVEERLAKANADRQLQLAGQVQRRMIPARPPEIPGFDIASSYETTLQLGGDFYDFFILPNHNYGCVIADVCGKGAPAAMLMAAVRSAFRIHTQNIFEVTRIMQEINRQLERDTLTSEFTTVWYGVIDPVGMVLTYVNAGHEYPFLLRKGKIRELERGGLVVGVDPNATYEYERIALKPHDVILLYTDGASEAASYDGEPFGRQRLQEALVKYSDLPAAEILRNIRMDIWRFIGLKQQGDDMTLVCIKVGASEDLELSHMGAK